MRKQIWSILLTLCMVLAMMPAMSITASADAAPTVYVGGTNVATGGTTYWLNNDGGITAVGASESNYNVKYDPNSGGTPTLTLNNAAILTNHSWSSSDKAAIYADGSLDIVLAGNNTAVGAGISIGRSYGVYVNGVVSISGAGSLTATGGSGHNGSSVGIRATVCIEITGGTVNAIGNKGGDRSCGLLTGNGSSCSVIISGGTVNAIGGDATSSNGIFTYTFNITGGTVTAVCGEAGSSDQEGVSCTNINVNNGNGNGLLVAKGEEQACSGNVVIDEGSMLLTGSPSVKFAAWGPKNTYAVLNSALNLDDYTADTGWSDSANSRGWRWDYNASGTSTLTLKNIIVNAPDNASGNCFGIYRVDNDTDIVLEGINVVSAGTSTMGNSLSCGVSMGNTSISGTALIALGGGSTATSCGIWTSQINVSADKVIALSSGVVPGGYNYGIRSANGAVFNSDTTIAVSGFGEYSYGMADANSISMTGGTTIAVSGRRNNSEGSYGMKSATIQMTGGSGAAIASADNYGSGKAFSSTPQGGNLTSVPTLTGGNWSGKTATWKVMQKITPPTASVDYTNEKLTELTANASYEVNDTPATADESGKINISNDWFGTTISLVKKGDGINTIDSDPQSIELADRPAALTCPVTQPSASSATGTITGITTAMQYSIDGGSNWTNGTGSNVTGLAPGTVLIRTKATGSAPAGLNQTITIIPYSEDPTYTISAYVASFDFGSLTEGYSSAPAAQTITITNTGNQTITLTEPSTTNASSNYIIGSLSLATPLAANGTATFTLQPKTGLAVGDYDETINIHGSNGSNNADASVTVQFSVTSSGGGGGGGGSAAPLVTKIESGNNVTGTNLDNLVKEGKKLTVEGKAGEKLVFDTEALKNIDSQTKDSMKVEIKDVSTTYKNEHPDRLVVSLTITAGGKHITSFGKGTATVSLPYELKAGEKAKDVTVWYLAEDGTMSEVPCTYDATTKLATFKVNHFSLYVVGTADTSTWTNPFSDVMESSWFYDAVRYVSANELMNGTTDTTFNPGAKTTRGMIVTILWRMENEPKASKDMTFTDVENGKYYRDAVAWASEKGIVGGYSAEDFGPENNITREQLAVILHNYASFKGYQATASGDLSVFGDSGKVHSWSKDSLSWANAEGLINGTGSNLLDPLGAAERCQVAAILQRFIENTAK